MSKLSQTETTKDHVDLITYMPKPVLADLKRRLAPRHNDSLTEMYDRMIRSFFREGPWLHGLKWREMQLPFRSEEIADPIPDVDGSMIEAPATLMTPTGWVQVDMPMESELAERVKSVAAANGVSPSTVLYTAVYYWIWYKNPTPEIEKIRKTRHEQWKARELTRAQEVLAKTRQAEQG